jgi:hypothetical protein
VQTPAAWLCLLDSRRRHRLGWLAVEAALPGSPACTRSASRGGSVRHNSHGSAAREVRIELGMRWTCRVKDEGDWHLQQQRVSHAHDARGAICTMRSTKREERRPRSARPACMLGPGGHDVQCSHTAQDSEDAVALLRHLRGSTGSLRGSNSPRPTFSSILSSRPAAC